MTEILVMEVLGVAVSLAMRLFFPVLQNVVCILDKQGGRESYQQQQADKLAICRSFCQLSKSMSLQK